jgi:hypothetical protein
MRTRSTGSVAVERVLVGLDVAAALVDVELAGELAVILHREDVVAPFTTFTPAGSSSCPAVTRAALADLLEAEDRVLDVVVEREREAS